MALLRLQDIQLAFGASALLDQLELNIDSNERIALIGRNGAGKSTLLKVIEGSLVADAGERILQNQVKVSYLSQDIPETTEGSVFDVVASGLEETGELLAHYHQLSHQQHSDDGWLQQLEQLQQQIENQDGWKLQQQVEQVISRLSLPADSSFASLSGGLKRRVLLARAILQQPDILLLDEPTNHLDIPAIQWLEEFLRSYNGSLVFITHDRTFLQNLATRIIELDRGKLASFSGDYKNYLRRKDEMLHAEALANEAFDKKLAQEEIWIRKGIKARRTRNEGRVRALKKMREERSQRRNQQANVKLDISAGQQSGKLVVEAQGLNFSWGDKTIVKNLDTLIMRGDKVGILGPNGSGKSTLLKLLLGQLQPDSGTIRTGANIQVAYFDQLRAELEPEKNIRDNLDHGSDRVEVNGKSRHVISYLQDFLFTPDRIHTPVKILSGGEKNRLLLARLFLKPANVLVMDEPTNDLDIETLELLEELLSEYRGTLLLVSHDRSFINNIVTSTLAIEGNGIVNEYIGGYDDWLRQRKAPKVDSPQDKPGKTAKQNTTAKKVPRLGYKENLELNELPGKIEALEQQLSDLQETLSSTEFYQNNPNDIQLVTQQLEDIEKELETSYLRWEELEIKKKASGK